MSAHSFLITLDRVLREGFARVADPGASGTFGWDNKGAAIVEVATAAAESRVLPAASGKALGTPFLVSFKTDGGDLTITGAQQSVVLRNAGDMILFIVGQAGTTKAWKVMADSRTEEQNFGARTVDIPLSTFRVATDITLNLTTEALCEDSANIGLRSPTVGTTAAALVIKVSNATTAPKAIVPAVVPLDYKAGTPISIVIPYVREDAATTSASLDLVAYRSAAPTVDICATALQDINGAASGTTTFVLTPTDVVPGETILLQLVGAVVDATTALFSFPRVTWSYTR